jgi:hypothetical protein
MAALSAYRQTTAMPQTAIRAHLDVALDVERNFLTEIAFHRAFFFENLADMIDLFFGQIANFLVRIDTGPIAQALRPRPSDSVDVSKANLSSLFRRKIDARNTCHIFLSLTLALLVLRVDANDPDHAFAVNQLALHANFLN